MMRCGTLLKVKNFNAGVLTKRGVVHSQSASFASKGKKELPFSSLLISNAIKGKEMQKTSFVNFSLFNKQNPTRDFQRFIQPLFESRRYFSNTPEKKISEVPLGARTQIEAGAKPQIYKEKPLEKWRKEEIEDWLRDLEGGKYCDLLPKLLRFNGKELAEFKETEFQAEFGGLIGGRIFRALQELKKPQQEVSIAWLEEMLNKEGITIKLPRDIQEYKKLDKPDPETQQKVLGSLFLRSWPLDTTSEGFNFMYSDTNIGKTSLSIMQNLLTTRYKIITGVGLSGAGKSHLATQMAFRGIANVLFYDCSRDRNAGILGIRLNKRSRPELEKEYDELAEFLEHEILNFTLTNAFIYLQLVKNFKIEPVQFVRYLENGGIREVEKVFKKINENLQLDDSRTLKGLILTEIKQLTGLPVVEVWDEAGILTQWATDSIPYSKHVDNPKTVFDPNTKKLQNAGSAFTVACRVAKANISEKTIFFGTSLRLGNIEKDITGIGKQINMIIPQPKNDSLERKEIDTSKFMKLWSSKTVHKSLLEDIKLEGNISKYILDVVCYRLQGRPRLTAIFKRKLFNLKFKNPNLPYDELFLSALEDTEHEMRTILRSKLDSYLQEPVGADLQKRVNERLRLMIDLVIKPSIEIDSKEEHDLVDKGIVHIEAYLPPTGSAQGKVTYSKLEPLVMGIFYQILEEKGIKYNDVIIEWMKSIYYDINNDKEKDLKIALSAKGKAAEVLLAHVLILVSKELNGRPITEHKLFAAQKGTFLDDYALMVDNFQYDKGDLWKLMMERKRIDIALLPTNFMRPDLFLLLKCIEGTPSHAKFKEHVIPLTAGSKIFQDPNLKVYLDNVDSTDIQKIFTKNGKTIHKDREIAEILLNKTFPVKRALRICLLYNPHDDLEVANTESEIFIKLDFRHKEFMEILKRNYKTATDLLNAFISKV